MPESIPLTGLRELIHRLKYWEVGHQFSHPDFALIREARAALSALLLVEEGRQGWQCHQCGKDGAGEPFKGTLNTTPVRTFYFCSGQCLYQWAATTREGESSVLSPLEEGLRAWVQAITARVGRADMWREVEEELHRGVTGDRPAQRITNPNQGRVCSVEFPNAGERPAPDLRAWQPIETAPKDGTGVVVGWCHNHFDAEVAKYQSGFWRTSDGEALFKPDFWMPLPAPPDAALLLIRSPHDACEVHQEMSRVCERSTAGCIVKHRPSTEQEQG